MLPACAPLPAALVGDNESFESIPGGQEGASISDRKDRNVNIQNTDIDKAAYETLANQDGDLLIRIKEGMAQGVNAAVVATWARWRFVEKRTVGMVIGAARYIERCQQAE